MCENKEQGTAQEKGVLPKEGRELQIGGRSYPENSDKLQEKISTAFNLIYKNTEGIISESWKVQTIDEIETILEESESLEVVESILIHAAYGGVEGNNERDFYFSGIFEIADKRAYEVLCNEDSEKEELKNAVTIARGVLSKSKNPQFVSSVLSRILELKDRGIFIDCENEGENELNSLIFNYAVSNSYFMRTIGIFEEYMIKNINRLPKKQKVDPSILKILHWQDHLKRTDVSYSIMQEIVIDIMARKDEKKYKKAFCKIIPELPKIESFFRDPEFTWQLFDDVFQEIKDHGDNQKEVSADVLKSDKLFIKNLLESQRLYKEPKVLKKIFTKLNENNMIQGMSLQWGKY